MWFERLPLDHDGDDLAYARAVERVPDWKCPYCMNRCGDLTAEELAACLRIERDRVVCPTCRKLDEVHLDDEYQKCMRTRPVLKKATVSYLKQ